MLATALEIRFSSSICEEEAEKVQIALEGTASNGTHLFRPFASHSLKVHISESINIHAPATDPRLRLCGTQTHLFSAATKVYDAKCFFVATPERNATATRKEPLW